MLQKLVCIELRLQYEDLDVISYFDHALSFNLCSHSTVVPPQRDLLIQRRTWIFLDPPDPQQVRRISKVALSPHRASCHIYTHLGIHHCTNMK